MEEAKLKYNAQPTDRQVYEVTRQSIKDAGKEWKQEAEEGYDEWEEKEKKEKKSKRRRVELNCQQLKIAWERGRRE